MRKAAEAHRLIADNHAHGFALGCQQMRVDQIFVRHRAGNTRIQDLSKLALANASWRPFAALRFFDDREKSEPAVTEHKQLQMIVGAGYEELEEALAKLEALESEG